MTMDSSGVSEVDPITLLSGLRNRLRQPSGDVVSGFRSALLGATFLDVVEVETVSLELVLSRFRTSEYAWQCLEVLVGWKKQTRRVACKDTSVYLL